MPSSGVHNGPGSASASASPGLGGGGADVTGRANHDADPSAHWPLLERGRSIAASPEALTALRAQAAGTAGIAGIAGGSGGGGGAVSAPGGARRSRVPSGAAAAVTDVAAAGIASDDAVSDYGEGDGDAPIDAVVLDGSRVSLAAYGLRDSPYGEGRSADGGGSGPRRGQLRRAGPGSSRLSDGNASGVDASGSDSGTDDGSADSATTVGDDDEVDVATDTRAHPDPADLVVSTGPTGPVVSTRRQPRRPQPRASRGGSARAVVASSSTAVGVAARGQSVATSRAVPGVRPPAGSLAQSADAALQATSVRPLPPPGASSTAPTAQAVLAPPLTVNAVTAAVAAPATRAPVGSGLAGGGSVRGGGSASHAFPAPSPPPTTAGALQSTDATPVPQPAAAQRTAPPSAALASAEAEVGALGSAARPQALWEPRSVWHALPPTSPVRAHDDGSGAFTAAGRVRASSTAQPDV